MTVLVGGLLLFMLVLVLLQDRVVDLPSFLASSSRPVLFVLMAPVPLCAALMTCLESRLTEAEDSGVRSVRLLDAGLVLAAVAAAGGIGALLGVLLDSSAAPAAGRNAVFLVGLMLCVRAVVGSTAVMAPVVWIFAVILLGMSPTSNAVWAVLPEPAGDPLAGVAAAVALAAGLTLQLFRRRPATP
ncbi:hypothetical protein ACTWP5_02215 [Streptomyces sp. 4N509B]|uniref:hypothetical protein n=1 Tax=Streptomyces sp. 4N509B TaxID=3457413 RepID=UPI003FD53BE3